jgi:hypothetical protein
LLNRQTETLYRRNTAENERLEEQIRTQLELIFAFYQRRPCPQADCIGVSSERRCSVTRSDPRFS